MDTPLLPLVSSQIERQGAELQAPLPPLSVRPPTGPVALTCVGDESLQVRAGALVLQQLLGRHVREQHLEHRLRVLAVAGVGVPHGAVAQQRLWWGKSAEVGHASLIS